VHIEGEELQVKHIVSHVKVEVIESVLSIRYNSDVFVISDQAEVVIWLDGLVNPLIFKVTLEAALTSELNADETVRLCPELVQ
jgi:hypothetical protein